MAYRVERENVSDTDSRTSRRKERIWILGHTNKPPEDAYAKECPSRKPVGESGRDVADAASERPQRHGRERGLGKGREEIQALRCCQDVANTQGLGTQGLRSSWIEESFAHGQPGLSLRQSQGLGSTKGNPQPGLGGVVDGLASRVDCDYMETPDWWEAEPEIPRVIASQPSRVHRLKALGNGQVPRVAATAWVTLEKILRSDGQ